MKQIVTLPWPPAALTPNGQHGHWSKKAGAARAYKENCAWACKAAHLLKMDTSAVRVTVTFYPPSNRAYDLDNQLARIKQGLDAVAEAIGVDDSRWLSISLHRGEKRKGGEVEVHIQPETWRSVGSIAAGLVNRIARPEAAE